MFHKTITLQTNLTTEQVINVVAKEINRTDLITGTVNENIITGDIHRPWPLVDSFKSRIKVDATSHNNFSNLRIQVKFGIVSIGVLLLIWGLPLFSFLLNDKSYSLQECVSTALLILGFNTVTFGLLRLKLLWDVRLIRKWLREECQIRDLNK